MLLTNAPSKLVLPFANSGAKNTIPAASQIGITPGAASLTDGFPPLTRTPIVGGGVPPSGLDMNGILFSVSAMARWMAAGGGFVYDSSFATNASVAGYPKGARVLRTDSTGYWLNTVDDNTTDPETGGAGWVPDQQYGTSAITMTSSNVTLTATQAGKDIIVISGALTANLNLVFPLYLKKWTIVNNCTGAFTITCKTASGSGVLSLPGKILEILGDGTNIQSVDSQNEGSNASVLVVTGNLTLTAADVGKLIVGGSSTAFTVTLPLTASVDDGSKLEIVNMNAGNMTIQRQGTTDIINMSTTRFLEVLGTGDSLVLHAKPSLNMWYASGGTGQFGYSTKFSSLLSASGWQKLPSGLIIQWGTSNATNGAGAVITYPIAFPTAARSLSMMNVQTGGVATTFVSTSPSASNTQFTVISSVAGPAGFSWIAIGH